MKDVQRSAIHWPVAKAQKLKTNNFVENKFEFLLIFNTLVLVQSSIHNPTIPKSNQIFTYAFKKINLFQIPVWLNLFQNIQPNNPSAAAQTKTSDRRF